MPSEHPPNTSKIAGLNLKPVTSAMPPGGIGASGCVPGSGDVGKAAFQATETLFRKSLSFLAAAFVRTASGAPQTIWQPYGLLHWLS